MYPVVGWVYLHRMARPLVHQQWVLAGNEACIVPAVDILVAIAAEDEAELVMRIFLSEVGEGSGCVAGFGQVVFYICYPQISIIFYG